MFEINPNAKYYGQYLQECQIDVLFYVNRAQFEAAIVDGVVNEEKYEAASKVADKVAEDIFVCSRGRCTFTNLPFLRVPMDHDPENWYVPYQICEYQGSEENDENGIDLFSVTLSMEGGPFKREDIIAFRDFVQKILDEVAKEKQATVEFHSVSEYRRMTVNSRETLNLDA